MALLLMLFASVITVVKNDPDEFYFLSYWRLPFSLRLILFDLLEYLSFEKLYIFDVDSDHDGSGSGYPDTWAFPFSLKSVGSVSGVGSGNLPPIVIESLGDAVLLFVFFCVFTKRSWIQRWSAHRIILAPKILIFHSSSPIFKITFIIVFLLWPRPDHSICCNLTNTMVSKEPVRSIRWNSNSSSGDKNRPEFIRCVDGREPRIHEVWTFGEDSVKRKFHPTAQVDVGDVSLG